ncbi:MAG TPA: type I methionyl aminopeptidase, partial [Firmicutes bacterium]|nr:type I methionyl aminopeptidase [Bacillota bacterium]
INLKNSEEVEKIREAGQIASEVLDLVIELAHPGVSTLELDRLAETEIRKRGAIPAFKGYNGFPGTLCISIDEEVVHGIPSKKRLLESGQILSLDIGVGLKGFFSDMAKSVAVGNLSEEKLSLVRVTEEALFRGIRKAFPGNRLFDISYEVQSYVESHGFSVVRDYVGHGIGREIHEEPQVPNFGMPGLGPVLQEGLVICIEPMVNIGTYEVEVGENGWTVLTKDRKPSAHFEHTIYVSSTGPKILTQIT